MRGRIELAADMSIEARIAARGSSGRWSKLRIVKGRAAERLAWCLRMAASRVDVIARAI